MDFTTSGLPQTPRIQKCYERLSAVLPQRFGPGTADLIHHLSKRGEVLAEALGDEAAEPLICAQFLSFLDRDTYEYDNVRHDYGHDVFLALKNASSFSPLFSDPGFLHEVLKDPEVKKEARMLYMATAVAEMRLITLSAEINAANAENPAVRDRAACAKLIAEGCVGASPFLDLVMQEDLMRMTNALNRQPNPPRMPTRPPKYGLH